MKAVSVWRDHASGFWGLIDGDHPTLLCIAGDDEHDVGLAQIVEHLVHQRVETLRKLAAHFRITNGVATSCDRPSPGAVTGHTRMVDFIGGRLSLALSPRLYYRLRGETPQMIDPKIVQLTRVVLVPSTFKDLQPF